MKFTILVVLVLLLLVATSAGASDAVADSRRTRRGRRFWKKPASEEETKSGTTAVIFWLVAVSSKIAAIVGLVAVALYLKMAQQKKQRCQPGKSHSVFRGAQISDGIKHKASGIKQYSGSKQHVGWEADDTQQALHLTHRKATLLFAMAARQGATDAQMADALQKGLLTDEALQTTSLTLLMKASLSSIPLQEKKTRTTLIQAAKTQPSLSPVADAFAAALGAIPAEDWGRTVGGRQALAAALEAIRQMTGGGLGRQTGL
jgi:hypothetical protein